MARAGPTIFCFSGGVDTFHNLLTFPDRIETLAVLIGYAVDDAGRSGLWPPWRQACSLPSVAAGLQPAETRLNTPWQSDQPARIAQVTNLGPRQNLGPRLISLTVPEL